MRAPCGTAALLLALGVTLMAGPAAGNVAITFAPAEHFPTGSGNGPGPGAVTTIAMDVDRDGDVDVVATDWFGEGPLILRNAGAGRFSEPAAIIGAADVGALATGHLNGDDRPDLVGRDGSGVVAMIANGDGTFEPGDHISVSANAQQSVAVLDTNGDRRLDIVTPERQGIRVLLGRGDGTFAAGPVSPLTGLLADLKPANLDGDAVADLLVADATPVTQRVVALRGNGDGTFAESGSGRVGYGPEAVMAGDLDGDGRDDAISVDSFSVFNQPPSFSITVVLGDGHGGFRSPRAYPTGDGPVSGTLADLDKDGTVDVAVSAVGSSVVTVYSGDGAGELAEAGRLPVVRQPQTPVAADFDQDGRTDIAVPGVGQLSLLRNTTAVEAGDGTTTTTSMTGASGLPRQGTLPETGHATSVWVIAAALGASLLLILSSRMGQVPQRGRE